jgi:tetratricopeptide (TPR) repeat protein
MPASFCFGMNSWALVPLFAAALQGGPDTPTVSGSQLIREGRLREALDGYVQAAQSSPKSVAANEGAGVVLDLLGRYEEARKYFTQAIKVATQPDERVKAQRALATSFAFAGDCRGAEKADRGAYEYFLQAPDYYSAGEVADELGRMCLDAGDPDTAYDWYRRGHDAGLRESNIPTERKDLWEFRWAHARARIAARRGKADDARKFAAAAKAIFDKGSIPDQQVYLPYLTGYVAFYAGDFAAALADLRNADQSDPFIQCLIAQTYEKLGDTAKASEYYGKAAGTTAHSVPAAYARPHATTKLQ